MEFLIRDILEYINEAITCAMRDPAATLLVFMLLALIIITPGRKAAEKTLMALVICFIYLILTTNVISRTYIYNERRISLVPFTGDLYEMLENICLFIPLGMLMCGLDLITKPVKPWKSRKSYLVVRFFISLVFAGLFSYVIEGLQYYLLVGVFTLDDIICNTTGAMLGYSVVFLTVIIVGKFKSRKVSPQKE